MILGVAVGVGLDTGVQLGASSATKASVTIFRIAFPFYAPNLGGCRRGSRGEEYHI
jgi:hypothetical protein